MAGTRRKAGQACPFYAIESANVKNRRKCLRINDRNSIQWRKDKVESGKARNLFSLADPPRPLRPHGLALSRRVRGNTLPQLLLIRSSHFTIRHPKVVVIAGFAVVEKVPDAPFEPRNRCIPHGTCGTFAMNPSVTKGRRTGRTFTRAEAEAMGATSTPAVPEPNVYVPLRQARETAIILSGRPVRCRVIGGRCSISVQWHADHSTAFEAATWWDCLRALKAHLGLKGRL